MSTRFDIVTIFPHTFDSYFGESIIKRAQKKELVAVKTHNLRGYTTDKHKTVDDRPFGGGAGMVLKAEPILKAVKKIKKHKKTKIIILSAKGKQFNQKTAFSWVKKYNHFIFISGRYEGIDERVKTALRADEVSVGPYVLTDGDAAAMVIISALTRLIPGAITFESLKEESFGNWKLEIGNSAKQSEYPHYTRPEVISYNRKKYRVPKVLLSGDHKKIDEWRRKHSKANL